MFLFFFFFFQAEDGIRDGRVTGVQTCALPISGGAAIELGGGSVPVSAAAQIAALEGHVRELAARTQPAPDQKRTEEIDARLKKLEVAGAGAPAPASDPAMRSAAGPP